MTARDPSRIEHDPKDGKRTNDKNVCLENMLRENMPNCQQACNSKGFIYTFQFVSNKLYYFL